MDGRRFDEWTRAVTIAASRRAALRAAAGGAVAGALGLLRATKVAAANRTTCRGTGEVCRRDAQCCSERCRRGRCDCRDRGDCSVDRACCSGRCVDGRCAR